MARWWRRLGVVLVVTGILAGVGTSPAAASLGPAGCGYKCTGMDPNTYKVEYGQYGQILTTCARDAKTIGNKLEIANSGNYVELRYSPYCRTAWARQSSDPDFGGYAQSWIESYRGPSTSYSYHIWSYADHWKCITQACAAPLSPGDGVYLSSGASGPWSLMVDDAGLYARACIRHWWDHENQVNVYTQRCTPLY